MAGGGWCGSVAPGLAWLFHDQHHIPLLLQDAATDIAATRLIGLFPCFMWLEQEQSRHHHLFHGCCVWHQLNLTVVVVVVVVVLYCCSHDDNNDATIMSLCRLILFLHHWLVSNAKERLGADSSVEQHHMLLRLIDWPQPAICSVAQVGWPLEALGTAGWLWHPLTVAAVQ